MAKILRKIFLGVTVTLSLLVAIFAGLNAWVVIASFPYVHKDVRRLPVNNTSLVLGTSQFMRDGSPNPYFKARMQAAAYLYSTGKIKRLILSGSHTRWYNEPLTMKKTLLRLSIPASAMILDDAGFRTIDSVRRARKLFKQNKLIIITDDFHAYRAVFLARHSGINAVAYCSRRTPFMHFNELRIREWFARIKAIFDIITSFVHHLGADKA